MWPVSVSSAADDHHVVGSVSLHDNIINTFGVVLSAAVV